MDGTPPAVQALPQTRFDSTYQMEIYLLAGVLESVRSFLETNLVVCHFNLFGWHGSIAV